MKRAASIRCATFALLLAFALPASADDDFIEVGFAGREVYAIDGTNGRRSTVRLGLDERVVAEAFAGEVGIVVTSDRLLGITVGGSWVEERWDTREVVPTNVEIEERVGLVLTDRRALALVGGRGRFSEERFRLRESIVDQRVGDAIAIVATDERVLGLSPSSTRFAVAKLEGSEQVESIRTSDVSGTVRTNRNLWSFSARGGSWSRRAIRN